MRHTWLPAAVVLGGLVSIALFGAQNASLHREPVPPKFPTIFPKPTGQNGYEDFVIAADLLDASQACQEFENTNDMDAPRAVALGPERKILADPTAQRVLATMRAGLRKRIRSPRAAPEMETLVPELKTTRAVGRLLCAEMDVHFADGQTSQAIDCLNDGLNFGRAVQIETPMGGVVGLYIENISLHTFARHLNRLTVPDCVKLIQVAKSHLKQSDPQILLVNAERDMFLRSLRRYRTDPAALFARIDPGPNLRASVRDGYNSVWGTVRADPESGPALFDQAATLAKEHFDQTITELRRPVWERRYPVPSERDSPASKLVYSYVPPSYFPLGDRYASERAVLQMLAAHAAVLRRRQQSGRLPGSLEELKLGILGIDPFTGKSLLYTRLGDQAYEIRSVGGYDPGSAKRPPTGQRNPIVLAYPPQDGH